MGTEVESPNSNHHVSQMISDSFLFLEGEEDGGATNGNHPVSGGVSDGGGGGGPVGAAVVGASQSPGSPVKQDLASANGNNSQAAPHTHSTNTNCHGATSGTPKTVSERGITQDGTDKDNVLDGELQSPCKDTMIGNYSSVNSTSVGNVTGGSTGCSASDGGERHVSGLSDPVQNQGSGSPDQASAGDGDTDGISIKVNSHSNTCDKSPSSDTACGSGVCEGQQSQGALPKRQTLDKESHPVHISSTQNTHHQLHNAAAAASTSDTTEEAYEVRLREQARFIVGKVLNCNSLREALKKTTAWQKNRRLAWRDSSSSTHSGDFSLNYSASCGAGKFSNRHSDSQIHTGKHSSKINSASHRPHSEAWTGLESQTKTSEQTRSADVNAGVKTQNQQSNAREEQQADDCVPAELFDDRSPDTTCTVAASAAVKLRRKKSEVGSKPIMGEQRGSSDSPSSSPGQSPGPTKRQLLRSPVLRIKQEWNSVDITSDSDSSPRQSEDSDDDDDGGIYAESYRNSQWLYIGGAPGASTDNLDDSTSVFDTSLGDVTADDGDVAVTSQKEGLTLSVDSGLGQSESSPRLYKQRVRDDDLPPTLPRRPRHHRSESISTTASEIEFRKRYQAKTKRIVQRKSSTHTYQRMSERFYDEERSIVIEKGPNDSTFGFHIKGHHPVMVSTVETNSAAEIAGVKVGDAVIAVNDVNIMDVSHQEAIRLIGQDTAQVKLMLATDHRVLSELPLCSGFLIKQGGSGILKNWRRRWFLLKQDHCLYYYKTEEDKDPLGAIMLTNYTVTKAPEANRKHTFKAHKYGQRTYYFQAESEDDMNRWASALSNAAKATTKTDTWLDVSSHNVGLPALSIKSPDCHGQLTKMGNRRKNWKRRYCVLKDACLYYYIDLTSCTAQGVAHLHGYTVEENLPFNKKFGFTLVPPDVSMRTFYFCADHETDMKRWIKALQKSIGRWIREEDE